MQDMKDMTRMYLNELGCTLMYSNVLGCQLKPHKNNPFKNKIYVIKNLGPIGELDPIGKLSPLKS
jgi:hypothetical protein